MSISAREIIELNIKYFREKLEIETDPPTRKTIAKLLREEEVKLARLVRSVSSHNAAPALPNPAVELD